VSRSRCRALIRSAAVCAASLRREVSAYPPPLHPHPLIPGPPGLAASAWRHIWRQTPGASSRVARGEGGARRTLQACALAERPTVERRPHCKCRARCMRGAGLPWSPCRDRLRGRARSREIARAGARAGNTWQIGVSGRARDGARWQSAAISARDGARWQSAAISARSTHPYVRRACLGGRSPS